MDDTVRLPGEVIQQIDHDYNGAMRLYNKSFSRNWFSYYLIFGNGSKGSNDLLNVIKALDNKQYHIDPPKGVEVAISKEDLLALHRRLRAQVIKEIELTKRGLLDYNATQLSKWISRLLKGEDIFNKERFDIPREDEMGLMYAIRYLGKKNYLGVGVKTAKNQMLKDVIEQVSSEEPEYELSPLENYLIEKGDLFNYMEILEELSNGRVLPGAHHAILLHYYIKTRGEYFTFDTLDSLMLDKVLSSDPLEFKDVVDVYYAPVYSDPRKWSEFFIQTYRYVKKDYSRAFILNFIFTLPDKVYLPESFDIDEEISKIRPLVGLSSDFPEDFSGQFPGEFEYEPDKFSVLIENLEKLKNHKDITYLPSA